MSDIPTYADVGEFKPSSVSRTAGAGDADTDPLDQFRYSGLVTDSLQPTGAQNERSEFRREAERKLTTVVSSLEEGRDRMTALHALAKSGAGFNTKEYADTFKQATDAYRQSIQNAQTMLYDRDEEGRLVPNRFYRDTEREREQLKKEMATAKNTNPTEYQRLAQQDAMLGDVLRANGYAYANFGLALLRSSVYLPKDERDRQMSQGNEMLMLASRYDRWMMGDPPNVPPDANFMKHQNAIMKAVNATPYIEFAGTAGTPVAPAPTSRKVETTPVPPLPVVEVTSPTAVIAPAVIAPPEITSPAAVITPPEITSPAAVIAPPEITSPSEVSAPAQVSPEGVTTADVPVTEEMLAKIAPLDTVGKAFLASGIAYSEVAALHAFATEVKLLRAFDAQVKALKEKSEATPEKIAELQTTIFSGDMAAFFGPKANPNLANNIALAIQTSQDRNFGRNQYLSNGYNSKVRPNLADEIQLDETGTNLAALPAPALRVFAEANQVMKDNPPEKIREMVAIKKTILQRNFDNMVPKAEQEKITTQFAALRADINSVFATLPADVRTALADKYGELAQAKGEIGDRYLQANPQFQSEVPAIFSSTRPDSAERDLAIEQVRAKYMTLVEADPKYQAEVQAAEERIFAQLKSINPNVESFIAAGKALDDFVAGSDGTPTQTVEDKIRRSQQRAAVDRFPVAMADLDSLLHTAAVVQGQEARALFFSNNPADQKRSAELMAASMQDEEAGKYLVMEADKEIAANLVAAASMHLDQALAPPDVFTALIPGSGFAALGVAHATNGLIFNNRIDRQNASTTSLAAGFAYAPKYTQAQIDAAQVTGVEQGNSLLRDGGSMAAYGLSYYGMGLLKLGGKAIPGLPKLVVSALVAGGTSDILEDGKLDGPINNPGAWVRGAGMGLGAHGTYKALSGSLSHSAVAKLTSERVVELGGQSAINKQIPWLARTITGIKQTSLAYINPMNMIGRNALVTEAKIATADAAQILATQRSLGAMQWYRTVETAFAIGAGSEGLKIIDGKRNVANVSDALSLMASAGGHNALVAGLIVPGAVMIPKQGLSLIGKRFSSVSTLLASEAAGTAYAFTRTYSGEFTAEASALTKGWALRSSADSASNPNELASAIRQLDPKLTETQAKAKALMYLQMRRGQELRDAP